MEDVFLVQQQVCVCVGGGGIPEVKRLSDVTLRNLPHMSDEAGDDNWRWPQFKSGAVCEAIDSCKEVEYFCLPSKRWTGHGGAGSEQRQRVWE